MNQYDGGSEVDIEHTESTRNDPRKHVKFDDELYVDGMDLEESDDEEE